MNTSRFTVTGSSSLEARLHHITGAIAEVAQRAVAPSDLRALVLIGQGGPAKANPAAVIEAVAALSRVGLTREAAGIQQEDRAPLAPARAHVVDQSTQARSNFIAA